MPTMTSDGTPRVAISQMPPKAAQPARDRRWQTLPWLTLASVVVALTAWELASRTGLINPLIAGRPTAILAEGRHALFDSDFWYHFAVSATEFGGGFAAAITVGIPAGLAVGWFKRLGYMVAPWLDAFNAVPRIALLPLVIIWLGIGLQSKMMLVFLSAVGLIAMNTYLGVRTVDPRLLDVGRVFGASTTRRLAQIVFPATLPFTLAGIRMGLGSAVIGVLFAESYGANSGLGYLMQNSAQSLNIDRYFFLVLVFVAIGAASFWVLSIIEKGTRRRMPEQEH